MLKKTFLIAAVLLILCSAAWGAPRKISMNFVDVDLATFAKFVSDTTGKNFIFDDRLKGKVTIITPAGLSKSDTFNLFTSVLGLKGFTLQPSGVNAYKIIPVAEAKTQNLPIQQAHVNDSYTIRLIPLKYISAEDAVKFLGPVISRDGYISGFSQGNYLLVIDSGLNIEKIIGILGTIDAPPIAEQSQIIFLKYSSADEIARILNEGMQRTGGVPGMGVQAKAIAEPRLNAVILLGDKGDKEAMARLISRLDIPAAAVQGGINVYFLEHANAEDLAKTLQGVIAAEKKAATPGAPAQAGAAALSGAGNIVITPDKATNSLVIMASQSDYQNLISVIKKLDRQRKQVFVQALIVEATINDLRDIGTKWRLIATKGGSPVAIGGIGTIDPATISGIASGLSGLTLGGLGNFLKFSFTDPSNPGTPVTLTVPGYAALFNFSDFKDAIDVLSEPQIFTSDNEKAEILVGENVPFPVASQSAVTTTGAATSGILTSVQRNDVGIKLDVTPHTTEGNTVRLDVYQEISAVQSTASGTDATAILTQVGPTLTKRSTKTSVFVNSGQTVVIGGLMSETMEKTVTKMPLLGDIPILGYLFKEDSLSKVKTNLLVFITPIVINSPSDMEGLTATKSAGFGKASGYYQEGELIIRFGSSVSGATASGAIESKGAVVLKDLGNNTYLVRLRAGEDVKAARKDFMADPRVLSAEPNYQVKTTVE